MCSPYLKSRELGSSSLEESLKIMWNFSTWEICLFSICLFIQQFIYITMKVFVILWAIIPYYFILFLKLFQFGLLFCFFLFFFWKSSNSNVFYFVLFVVFGHACCMQKFLGQGSNLCHSSDDAGSLIYWATRELLLGFLLQPAPISATLWTLQDAPGSLGIFPVLDLWELVTIVVTLS